MTMRSPSEFSITALADLSLAFSRTVPSKFELDEGLLVDLRRAADVEGTHRELGARLADRLRRDDADRFTHIDRACRAQGRVRSRCRRRRWPISQVSTERIFTSCTFACVISSTSASSSNVPFGTTTLPIAGSSMSSAVVRPRMRMPSEATTVPASMMARTLMPDLVPQSCDVMMQSCATSTRRRVR